MITTCTGCQARYRLDAAKVPLRRIRVRCPECATIFDLDGTRREEPRGVTLDPVAAAPAASVPAPEPAAAPTAAPVPGSNDLVLEPTAAYLDRSASPAGGAPTPDRAPGGQPATPRSEPVSASATATAELPPVRQTRRTRRDKTEMLARALVSDILVYNQEARDQALAAGNLLETLGPEIKKSWELYKEKVGAETATSTTYFKDALNDILADGQAIF